MSNLEQPDIRPYTEKYYRLHADYIYEWKYNTKDREGNPITIQSRITAWKDFVYDGASVPRFLWTLTGYRPDGLHRAAALIHDWIYVHKGILPKGSHQYQDSDGTWRDTYAKWSRKDADRIFGRILKESGVRKRKRKLMVRAVMWFGGTRWRD